MVLESAGLVARLRGAGVLADAVPPDDARRMLAAQPLGVRLSDIGQFVAESSLWIQDAHGGRHSLAPRGWEHK